MIESLSKGFKEMKASQPSQWPILQVPSVPPAGQAGASVGKGDQYLGVRGRGGANLTAGFRGRSPSLKRSDTEAELNSSTPAEETAWTDVVNRKNQGRKQRPVQYGVAKVNVAGGEAAPYDVVIGNTNPGSTKEIISEVLQKVALQVIEELKPQEPLQILEVECLTKPREDGRKVWVKTWRYQTSLKSTWREQKPYQQAGQLENRAARPPVPGLDPTVVEPPGKRVNVEGPPHPLN